MSSLQPITFHTVDEFLDFLPENERKVVDALREVVFFCIPHVEEKLAYNVPYYYGNSRICFIWPATVPWGKVKMNGVTFGFCEGHRLQDELNYLDESNRKVIRTKTFQSKSEIDLDLLKAFLFEAETIDSGKKKMKIRKKGIGMRVIRTYDKHHVSFL